MDIQYPYMPTDRHLKYAAVDNPFMIEAAKAREECAGDPLYPVGIVLVKDGRVVARAGNGFNRGPGKVHVCPRVVLECPSGTGYDLCSLHDAAGHSEPMLIEEARRLEIDTVGADAYMFGHWWACEPCWKVLIDAGVRDLYVTDDAHERFSRDKVYAQTLNPSVTSAYIAGPITNVEDFESQKRFYEALGLAAEEMGCRTCIPHRDNGENQKSHLEKSVAAVFAWATGAVHDCDVIVADVSEPSLGTGGELMEAFREGKPIVLLSKKGSRVSAFVRGNPAVVYHIEYDDQEQAVRQLKQVLRQL
jgi:2'-deoxynucleoside 5'-phosphate N-hydrolase